MTPSADTEKRDPKEVKEMFARVAQGYDFVNHAMCLGLDIIWRKRLVKTLLRGRQPGGIYLDLACGSGDVALSIASADGKSKIIGVDFCPEMLGSAKAKASKGSPKELSFWRRTAPTCLLMEILSTGLQFLSDSGILKTARNA